MSKIIEFPNSSYELSREHARKNFQKAIESYILQQREAAVTRFEKRKKIAILSAFALGVITGAVMFFLLTLPH